MFQKFLEHFNTIDKHLDDIIASEKFLPYNEKINKISHGHYPITHRIKHHNEQLKHFGEIRNLITHHTREDRHYVQITQEAIDDIAAISIFITQPPTARKAMIHNIVSCQSTDTITDMLAKNNRHYDHILIIDDDKLIGGVSYDTLLPRLAKQSGISLDAILVSDIPIIQPHHYYQIAPETDIMEAIHILANHNEYYMLIIGDEKKPIQGTITRHDIPRIIEKIL